MIWQVRKRDGRTMPFNMDKITSAIEKALRASGELSEEELENVSGGQCKNGGKYVVIATTSCEQWKCPKCGGHLYDSYFVSMLHDCSDGKTQQAICNNCAHCTYERGLWLCDNTDFWDNVKYVW